MLSKKALSATAGAQPEPVYVEDVFSTYLYRGNGSSQSIPNGVNLGGAICVDKRFIDSSALNTTIDTTQNGDWIVVYHVDTNGVGGTCTVNGSSVTASSTFGDAYGYAHRIFLRQVTTTSTTVVTNSPSSGFVSCYVFRGPTSITIGKDFTATSGIIAATGTLSTSGFAIILLSDRDADATPTANASATYQEAAATFFQVRAWGRSGTGTSVPSTYLDNLQGGSNYQGAYIVLNATGAGTNSKDTGTGKGGLVWLKRRDGIQSHGFFDSVRVQGLSDFLSSDLTGIPTNDNGGTMQFTSNGFVRSLESYFGGGGSGNNNLYASWTFAKQQKFFDIVTWTGNGSAPRSISHSLGSTPGCVMIKLTSGDQGWIVRHRSVGDTPNDMENYVANDRLFLNTTAAAGGSSNIKANATTLTVNHVGDLNANGATYVAYLFAHDAGGFGLTGNDNVISCGAFTTDGSGSATVTLGYEPQWILRKISNGASTNWTITDVIRRMDVSASSELNPNLSNAEVTDSYTITPTATGFRLTNGPASLTFVYIAIRRGPMKVPTDATSVFQPVVYTGTNVDNRLVTTTIAPDLIWARQRNDTVLNGMILGDRVRGNSYLVTGATLAGNSDADSLMTPTNGYGNSFSAMNGFGVGNDVTSKLNASTVSNNQVVEAFKRAPGFMDIVVYTGTATNTTLTHNLGVAPEIIIYKKTATTSSWFTTCVHTVSNFKTLTFNGSTSAGEELYYATGGIYSAPPSTTAINLGGDATINAASTAYVAYMFATLAGVSKVGTYTGTGTTNQINCGFVNGARLVLIKRLDGNANWYLWDSARGISASSDPYFIMDSANAEVTGNDYVDPYSAGFELSSSAPGALNVSGGLFLFLAIA